MINFEISKQNRLDELSALLHNPPADFYTKPTVVKATNAEFSSLSRQKEIVNELNQLEEKLKSNAELLKSTSDAEMSALLKDEHEEISNKSIELKAELEELESPKDPKDYGNCIMEIRAGTGGEEAALFAKDLYRMYSRYCQNNNYKIELIDTAQAENGGLKEIIFNITGDNSFGKFKNEAGVHRVQRIPATENAGRIHTSAASVVVLPIVEAGEVEIKDQDLRIDVYRSSGAGGQGVNTTDSAVRITHIPTGIVVTCQDGRSQIKNKESALSVLRSKLYERELEKVQGSVTDIRKNSIRNGDRSDKIKTYNYPQNRVTDHRTKTSWYKLDGIMEGDIEELLSVNLNKVNEDAVDED